MSVQVKREVFSCSAYSLECGRTIPVEMGYETYGTLNGAGDNAVLISHYFSAFGHAAGTYSAADPAPGFWDGLIGPGTGTFMIMAFTMALSMDLLTASGCAKIANLCSNVASAVLFIFSGKVWWLLALPAAACNMLGAYCGARYAMKGGSKRVRGMIFVVLGLLFIKMGYELLF